MSISQYVIGGTMLVTALAVGYAKWVDQGAKVDKAEARTAIVKAECATNTALDTTEALNQQIADLTAQVDRQRKIAADRAAAERLAWSRVNKLKAEIANVQSNPPVPDSIELVLDRLRSSVDGGAPDNGADKDKDDGAPGADLDGVSASTDTTAETSTGEHTER